ncbi:MAG: class I SAM-dependent methyltransferase [Wenzhouxiangellaceae bacterium]
MNEQTELPFSPACERNREPILAELKSVLPASGRVLEIGSGTAQHAVHFAAAFPQIIWQPSDQPQNLPGIQRRLAAEGGANIAAPLSLDVTAANWPEGPFQAAFSANTAHIMAWTMVEAMFAGIGRVLAPGAPFALYGPFILEDESTAPSNLAFDDDLRRRDPAMGLRQRLHLDELAATCHLSRVDDRPMPANNRLLIYIRNPS